MNRHAAPVTFVLIPLLLLNACGSSPEQRSARLLNERLQSRLGPDIAAGRVALRPVANGAQVTLLDPTLFPNDKMALDGRYPDVRADMIEGMLDPGLMRVQVADTSALPQKDRVTRVLNVEQYFVANGLRQTLQETGTAGSETGPATPGLNVTMLVDCSPHNGAEGYGNDATRPGCR